MGSLPDKFQFVGISDGKKTRKIVYKETNRKKASQPTSGFLIMALFAERFPVRLIPEQPLVSPVRNDMIHNGRRDYFPLCLTESTEWMLL